MIEHSKLITVASNTAIPFGVKDGRYYSAGQVERGLSCECTCPSCGRALVANQGKVKHPYFRHHVEACEKALAASLHGMAMQIVMDSGWIMHPAYDRTPWIRLAAKNYSGKRVYLEPGRVEFDDISAEVQRGDYRPDLLATISGKELAIEIRVTHEVDAEKEARVTRDRLSMIEVDLSRFHHAGGVTLEKYTAAVLGDVDIRKWVYSERGEELFAQSYADLEKSLVPIAKEEERKEAERKEAAQRALAKRKEEAMRKKARKQYIEQRTSTIPELGFLYTVNTPNGQHDYLDKLRYESRARLDIMLHRFQHSTWLMDNIAMPLTVGWWLFPTYPGVWKIDVISTFIAPEVSGRDLDPEAVYEYVVEKYGIDGRIEHLYNMEKESQLTQEEIEMIPAPWIVIERFMRELCDHSILVATNTHNRLRYHIPEKRVALSPPDAPLDADKWPPKSASDHTETVSAEAIADAESRLKELDQRVSEMVAAERYVLAKSNGKGIKCCRCKFISSVEVGKIAWCDYCNARDVDTGYLVTNESIKDAKYRYHSSGEAQISLQVLPSIRPHIHKMLAPYLYG